MIVAEQRAMDKWPCPIARTFGEPQQALCRGRACPLWRWKPWFADDPRLQSAVLREIALIKGENHTTADGKPWTYTRISRVATDRVMGNPHGYVLASGNDQGFCGLGGEVRR